MGFRAACLGLGHVYTVYMHMLGDVGLLRVGSFIVLGHGELHFGRSV